MSRTRTQPVQLIASTQTADLDASCLSVGDVADIASRLDWLWALAIRLVNYAIATRMDCNPILYGNLDRANAHNHDGIQALERMVGAYQAKTMDDVLAQLVHFADVIEQTTSKQRANNEHRLGDGWQPDLSELAGPDGRGDGPFGRRRLVTRVGQRRFRPVGMDFSCGTAQMDHRDPCSGGRLS